MADAPVQNQDPTTDPKDADPASADPNQDPNAAAAGTDADDVPDPEGTDALGDAGKKALDSMKSRYKEERDKRRALERELAELKAPKASGDGDPQDADQIRAQVEREALAKANKRIVRSELKAAAAGKLADPTDALVYLDPNDFEVDADGNIDAEEIREAIEDLLSRKPYLAATGRPRFQGSGDGGAARKASGPSQLTREDLKSMSPADIVKAKREGRLKKILSGD